MQFDLTVEGVPVAKARPRLSRYGTYTPKKTVIHEQRIRDCWEIRHSNMVPSDKPLRVDITFYMSIPKSTPIGRRIQMLEKDNIHTMKPDIDNLIKTVFDALNGVAYEDDKQISDVHTYKRYSEQPRTEITITEKW